MNIDAIEDNKIKDEINYMIFFINKLQYLHAFYYNSFLTRT